jgi:hypothetical protein
MEVMGLEKVTPEEVFNRLLELEISRTEVALRTFVSLRRAKKRLQTRPVKGYWSKDREGEYKLVIKVRATFDKEDYQSFINSCTDLCSGEWGFSCTLFVLVGIHENPTDRVKELLDRGISQQIRVIFKDNAAEEITKFLLEDSEV